MSAADDKPRLLLVRRVGDGIGGAAKTLRKFEQLFAAEWLTGTLSAGGLGGRVAGARGPSWWRNLRFAATANAALKNTDADLIFTLERGVHADVYRTADGVHRRWLELSGAGFSQKLVNPLHGIVPRLERDTMRSVRRIVCQGEMIAADVAREYPDCADKIRVIPTGYDPTCFYAHPEGREAAKRAANLEPGVRHLLFVGSGWKIKNLADTIRLFAGYAGDDKDRLLLVAGEGKVPRYARLAEKLGVADRVRFLGAVADIATLMRAADAVLMPSLYDTFPNAALEAAACGAPLILTETNGATELVKDGVTGLILPHGFDPASEAAKLNRLMATPPSPALVAAATAGRTKENEKRLYLALFAEILAEKRASR